MGRFAQALNLLLSVGTTLLLLIDPAAAAQSQVIDSSNYPSYPAGQSHGLLQDICTGTGRAICRVLHGPNRIPSPPTLKSSSFNWKLVYLTGVSLGCLILSRQWGFFMYPALGLLAVLIYLSNHPSRPLDIAAIHREWSNQSAHWQVSSIFIYTRITARFRRSTLISRFIPLCNRPTHCSVRRTYATLNSFKSRSDRPSAGPSFRYSTQRLGAIIGDTSRS